MQKETNKNTRSIVVIGGQYGSEGKGQFVGYLARTGRYSAAVRTGGPNAGHTVTYNGDTYKMRHIPTAWVMPDISLYLGPGGLVDPKVLADELTLVPFQVRVRFWVDRYCTVISESHRTAEAELRGRIGSTMEGIGAARASKAMRNADTAGNLLNVARIVDVPEVLANEQAVIVESTQGFGLSLELSGHYPFVTSANITPGHVLGESGLSSRIEHEVVAVMRTYPIRVAGNSGPMHKELSWEGLSRDTGGHVPAEGERTTVTQLVRRIGSWDSELAKRMSMVCRPDYICLTFLDYVFPNLTDLTGHDLLDHLTDRVLDYLTSVQKDCGARIRWVSTGPGKITDLEMAR